MIERQTVDPQLHRLRSIARSTDGRTGQELESARFNLFAALEAADDSKARAWLESLRVGLLAADIETALREAGLAAVREIAEAMGGAE